MNAPSPRPSRAPWARTVAALALVALTLVACTRERPTPEPTATFSAAVGAEPSGGASTPAPAVVEADNTPVPNPEAALAVTATPGPTPTAGAGEPFQYVVRAGDTLSTIAARFGTDVATLRQLNNLPTDDILIGQPIYVPYVEGMTAEGAPTPTPGPFLYTIQPGDTLSGIGTRFGIESIRIMEANNLVNPDTLTVGTEILIPGYQPPAGGDAAASAPSQPVAPEDRVMHTVQPGEGLIGIADLYGVTVEEIVTANGILDRNTLRVGQRLLIPGITARELAAARSVRHVVVAGESLLSIAIRYGVTVDEILTLNELANPDAIFIGQELLIPGN